MTRRVAVVVGLSVLILTVLAQEPVAAAASADPIVFSKLAFRQGAGIATVTGEVQNRTAKIVSFTVTVGLYSPKGKLLGVATGAVNELHPGRVKIFQTVAVLTVSEPVRLAPQVETILPACP